MTANLLAFSSLTSHLHKERAIKPGDEVISVAAGFPTTVNPIFQNGAVPVFVDIKLPTYNINEELIEQAITKKTKAIIPVHMNGRSCDMVKINQIAKKHNLFVIEDAAQAIGSRNSKGLLDLNKKRNPAGIEFKIRK